MLISDEIRAFDSNPADINPRSQTLERGSSHETLTFTVPVLRLRRTDKTTSEKPKQLKPWRKIRNLGMRFFFDLYKKC